MPESRKVDWDRDPWFKQHHRDKVTPEFSAWWRHFAGPLEQFDAGTEHDYYVYAAYALAGWLARSSQS